MSVSYYSLDAYTGACTPRECVRVQKKCDALTDPCEGDPGCRDDQVCEVFVSGCGAEDDYCYRYPLCKDPPYG